MTRSGKTAKATEGGPGSLRRRRLGRAPARLLAGSLLFLLLAQGVALGGGDTAPAPTVAVAPLNPAYVEFVAGKVLGTLTGSGGVEVAGIIPDLEDPATTRGLQVESLLGVPPASYDLRTLSRVTSAKNQVFYNTCWAFAAMGSMESCLLLPPAPETWDFAENSMALSTINGFDDNDGPADAYMLGNQTIATAYLVRWSGPTTEADDPYPDQTPPTGLTVQKHVQEVNWIPARGSSTDNDNTKNAVQTYGAVACSLFISENAAYWKDSNDTYYYTGATNPNHGVLIVGWDDTYPAANFASTPPGNGAFIVKNSYGTGWGDNGYFYVSYYDTKIGREQMSVFNGAQPNTNYNRIYQYDPFGKVTGFGYAGSTVGWVANRFTALGSDKLSAVGFYTSAPNTAYEVYTGTGFSGTTLSGKTLRANGAQAYMGYHTVVLPTPVDLTSGQQFVVAVKLTTPSYYFPMTMERPVAAYSSGASSNPGESYVSVNGTLWDDLTVDDPGDPYDVAFVEANICVKAYTQEPGPPVITSLSPNFGSTAGGKTVVINGTGFTGATAVNFGGDAATPYTVVNSTRITATTPSHDAGLVDVQVTTPVGPSTNTAADDYTYMPPVTYLSYRGSDRYDTAIRLSQALFSTALPGESGLVVAPGETFPEALCGAPLAAAYGGPVLLTYQTALANNVKAELQRLAPAKVFCIGMSAAAISQVAAALPGAEVTPINGAGTAANIVYDMSRKVANALKQQVQTLGGDISGATAIVTLGTVFPDAMGVSPLACSQLWPIILTDSPTNAPLHASATATFTDLGLTTSIKAGTYAPMPPGVTGLANLSGADRYFTNAAVATWATTSAGLTFAHTGLATGDKFPDALASGPYLAADDGVLLLSPLAGPLPAIIGTTITANRATVEEFTFIACIEPVIGQVKALLP